MSNPSGHFYHDASNRLTYEVFDLDASTYAITCDRIVNKFDLSPAGELIVGLDEMFRDYTDSWNGTTDRGSLSWRRMQIRKPWFDQSRIFSAANSVQYGEQI